MRRDSFGIQNFATVRHTVAAMRLRTWLARQMRRLARPAHDEVREIIGRAHGAVQFESGKILDRLEASDKLLHRLDTRIASLQGTVDRIPDDARATHDAMLELTVYVTRTLRDVRETLDDLGHRVEALERRSTQASQPHPLSDRITPIALD